MYDRVVTINNTHWPAYRKPGATLVDLRILDPDDRRPNPRLVFRPEKLRELGIPDALIEVAAKSDPQGFLLFDDLPDQAQQASGHADQAATKTQFRPAPKHTNPQKQKKPKTGGASLQVKETASRITSSRRKSFSAKPASSRNATSGSRLHSSSSESTGRKL